MLQLIRKSIIARILSLQLILSLLFQLISPAISFALTSGPGQEEFASFEPASTTDMVDLYTGDFNYNIPLLSVPGPNGGYPVNIAYHSGIGMEQEASWVGLGWTLNVGAISRNLRGLPDDFNGDAVIKTQHIKESTTVSLDIPINTYREVAGVPPSLKGIGDKLQLYYNNYKGLGTRYTMSANMGNESSSLGLNISHDSQNGMGIGLNFNAGSEFRQSGLSGGFGLGGNYNSRQGLQSFNFSLNINYSSDHSLRKLGKDDTGRRRGQGPDVTGSFGGGGSSSLSFATIWGVPKTNIQMKSTTVPFTLRLGTAGAVFRFDSKLSISGSVYTSNIENNGIDRIPAQGYLNTTGQSNALRDFSRQDIMYSKKIPHLGASSFTYDLYTQTGQGTGSMFRPYLNTFGVLNHPQKISKDRVAGGGFELGVGTSGATTNVHVGGDYQYGAGQNTSGPWTQTGAYPDLGHELQKLVNWNRANGKIDYEPCYFQVFGEKTGIHESEDQLISFKGDAALRLEIQKEKRDKSWLTRHFKASDLLVSNESKTLSASLTGSNQTKQQPDQKRTKRATSIETLTTAQASQYGFSKNVTYKDDVPPNPVSSCTGSGAIVSKDFSRPGHHISEISMLQPDGMRYVYGLPAYNNKQIDNVFAVTDDAGATANYPTTRIHTGGSKEYGGINVGSTYDQYVSKNELPQYAHSWMLTSVLSADYLDVTDDGPTDDDFGYWVKFNYKKTAANYKWRAPYVKANYLDGFKNNPNDNKGSYTYGEKDIFVLESIETKTHIAVFETSCRKDGYEAFGEYSNGDQNENFGRGNQTMQKLDRIKLYTKREYAQPNPIPTKVVNFEYSYDLCPNVPNNNGTAEIVSVTDAAGNKSNRDLNLKKGKLTLTKLFFTYQNSTRGKMSPYAFEYGDVNDAKDNPDYNTLNMDRWGNFRNAAAYGSNYPALENPYTYQENPQPPAPWTLKKISLPTGGVLNLDYEPDDYGYVENKQALRMFDICYLKKPNDPTLPNYADLDNFSNRFATAASRDTEEGNIGGGRNRVYFKLEKDLVETLQDLGLDQNYINNLTPADKNKWINKLYLDNVPGGYIAFKIYAELKGGIYDYVKGYAEIEPQTGGLYTVSNGANSIDYGYFDLKNKKLASPVNVTGIFVSPFTRASLEHLRAYRSDAIYGGSNAPGGGTPGAQIMNLVAAIPGQFIDLMATTVGFNNYAYQKKWGRRIQLNGYSTIRLCEPDYKKIGGGVRIKKISLNDTWAANATGASNSEYGQEYDYTKTTNIGGQTAVISSGVAYEPQVGREESALISPIPYTNSIPLHGSYNLFLENPIMDSYYPGASVGYSKVTVTSIAPDQAAADNSANTLQYSAAPISIYEYYTPKDFPVLFDKTDMNPGQPIRIPIMVPGLMTSFTTRQAKSQGYSLVLNDMAGKPKSITAKTRNGNQIISSQKFIYHTEKTYNEDAVNRLSNKVKTLEIDKNDNNKIKYTSSIIGQTHDMFIDMNEDAQEMKSFGLETNFDMQYTPPYVFLFMIMILPTIKVDESSMRTVVFNKIINRTGILKQVETTTNGSTIITENLAYDIETGEPILTKVTNEFKDPVYNFSYPGYWYYPNLAGAYQNFALKIDPPGNATFTSDISTGYLDLTTALNGRNISDFFARGDLLFVDCAPGFGAYDGEYHVFSISDPQNSMLLINSTGQLFPRNVKVESIQVLKSGFKNLQAIKVGGLAFRSIDPSFESYIPGLTPSALMELGVGATNNKIINASAVEYSNDWQVFCGPRASGSEQCICRLNPAAYDLLSMLQNLNTGGLLFSKAVPLYDMTTDVYSNGFSSGLLNTSQKLLTIKASQLAGITGSKKFYYWGRLSGNSLYVVISHDPNFTSPDPEIINGDCIVKIDLPAGANWGDIQLFTAVKAVPAQGGCNVPPGVILELVKNDGTTINANTAVWPSCPEPCGCWTFAECYNKIIPNYACGIQVGEPVNPYWAGMKGMWRPEASYAYNTGRTQNDNIREDGVFIDFVRFPWENPAAKDPKWIKATTVTKYSPYGFELENKDALGNYSSALYGYDQSLVTAIGSNATYNEIAFDNFEDYPPDCNDQHFKFTAGNITQSQAHTGKFSIQIGPSATAGIQTTVGAPCPFVPVNDRKYPTTPIPSGQDFVAHIASQCDCLGKFSPLPAKKYVISAWAKELSVATPVPGITNYSAPQLRITFSGAPAVFTFTPKGNVIDGWQQIFDTFDIPGNATGINVELVNTSTGRNVFFDDIRLHPNDGNMVSYVYDPVTLKTMAELDANNFATIYIYDDEGHLNKLKKETTEGIKTIEEGRINTKKINE